MPRETFCEVLRGFDSLTSSPQRGCGRQGIAWCALGGECKVVSLARLGGQSRTGRLRRWIGGPTETFCEVLRGFNVLVFPPTSVGVAALRKPCVGVLVKYWFVIGSSIKVERNGRLLGGALTSRED